MTDRGVITTRGDRGAEFEKHLRQINRNLTRLGRRALPEFDAVTLAVVWSTLRGMAVIQMMSYSPRDAATQRGVLVDMLVAALRDAEPAPPGAEAIPDAGRTEWRTT
ncbi:MAG: hypothetical protein INR72_00920 [Williamsia herbipolensis]|nr:hypothetical protein [Williamsia herbipolensis]